ncbi:hypothetical protein TRICHSKD4_5881 [Roseibium sp. TrichSKD4]|nr:hypothetical protein TRICHSKD4_5881 [Roseibium sp. TrichSKD4]
MFHISVRSTSFPSNGLRSDTTKSLITETIFAFGVDFHPL